MRTLKLILAYDGTRFVGWQRQRNGASIQAVLEDALSSLDGDRPVRVTGAGRTDAGVHAQGQVASCRFHSPLEVGTIHRALNARLPSDIRVLAVSDAPSEFHARFWARGKAYAYHVLNAPVADPLARPFVWHVPQSLDLPAMQRALEGLQGQHDFKAFQASGSRVVTTVRTLTHAGVSRRPWAGVCGVPRPGAGPDSPRRSSLLTFAFRGNGFLRHMVRNLVGTVVEVGLGRRPPGGIHELLASRDRRHAGATAPAHGLLLVSVDYGEGPVRPSGSGPPGPD